MERLAICGLGPDRPGIVAGLTGVLYDLGGNIEDSSMTILENSFTWIVIATLPDGMETRTLETKLSSLETAMGVHLFVLPVQAHKPTAEAVRYAEPHMFTVSGRDRTGITHRVSSVLARYSVNITDLHARTITGQDGPVYILMIEAQIPEKFDWVSLDAELDQLALDMDLEVRHHVIDSAML